MYHNFFKVHLKASRILFAKILPYDLVKFILSFQYLLLESPIEFLKWYILKWLSSVTSKFSHKFPKFLRKIFVKFFQIFLEIKKIFFWTFSELTNFYQFFFQIKKEYIFPKFFKFFPKLASNILKIFFLILKNSTEFTQNYLEITQQSSWNSFAVATYSKFLWKGILNLNISKIKS